MSNGAIRSGSYSTASKDKQWAAFDALPKSAREALTKAAFDWAPYPINRDWQAGRWKNAKALCATIAQWDERQIRRAKQK